MKCTSNLLIGACLTQLLITSASAQAPYVYGFAAKQYTLNGYDLFTDSYCSTDPARSTDGRYDPAKAGDVGNVWAEAGILNSVGVGNVSIWGKLSTGTSYALEIGPESSIGSMDWHRSGLTGIQPAYLEIGFVYQFPDPVLPLTTWGQPTEGTLDGKYYRYLLGAGNYELSELSLSGNEEMLVTGSAQLVVYDDLDVKGNAAIRIRPGASLKLYVRAATANIRGAGVLNEGVARQFMYTGLGSNKTLNLRLSGRFAGLIYAPQAVCYVTSKGNAPSEMEGAFMVQEVDLGTVLRLHYDEAVHGGTPRQ